MSRIIALLALLISTGLLNDHIIASNDGCAMSLTPKQADEARALEQANAYVLPGGIAGTNTVVLAMHVVRRSDGTGGLDAAVVAQCITDANQSFAAAGIAFCQFGSIVYLDNDQFYFNIDTLAEIDVLRNTAVVPNAINVYFTENLAIPGTQLCGISSFTFSGTQGIVMRNSCTPLTGNASTFIHELGHYFDLFHTHETGLGVECASGGNCAFAGDLVCDTPADPLLGANNVNVNCMYTGSQLGPCASDAFYAPDPQNHMSYAPHTCRVLLTAQQRQRALATLVNLRPELLDTSCNAPTFEPTPGMHLWSVTENGALGAGHTFDAWISADRSSLAFTSLAPNFVPNDTNNKPDIFVRNQATGDIMRASVTSTGAQSNGFPAAPVVSSDGRYIAYHTDAPNMVPGAPSSMRRIYRFDRQTSAVELVSRNSSGQLANDLSGYPAISGDSRHVAFASFATNLVAGDTNFRGDVFLRDLQNGVTTLVSITAEGVLGNEESGGSQSSIAMSPDARFIVFESKASTFASGDTNGDNDIYLKDMLSGAMERISVSSSGAGANDESVTPSVSADGRYVCFASDATNLVPNDSNGQTDIFLRDRVAGTTTRISVSSSGAQAAGQSTSPSISLDGSRIVFNSSAQNIADGATGNAIRNVYLYETKTGEVSLASPRGQQSATQTFGTSMSSISGDGAVAIFLSEDTNLVPNDSNAAMDVFGYELPTASIIGDITANGVVDVDDLLAVIDSWGTCPVRGDCQADIAPPPAGNGVVDVDDLLMVINNWD